MSTTETPTLDALTRRFTRSRFPSFAALCQAAPGYTPTFRLDHTGLRDGLSLAHAYNQNCVSAALVWDQRDGEWIALRPAAVERALRQQAAA